MPRKRLNPSLGPRGPKMLVMLPPLPIATSSPSGRLPVPDLSLVCSSYPLALRIRNIQ